MRLIQSSNNAKYTLILTKINFQEDIGKTAKRKDKVGVEVAPLLPFSFSCCLLLQLLLYR